MGTLSALFGFMFIMVLLILVAALVLSPILVPRYLRARRAMKAREATLLAEIKAQRAALSAVAHS